MKKRNFIVFTIIIIFLILIFISSIYYKNKYTVSFETGTDEKIITQYVSNGECAKKPRTPQKDGYVFIEWQIDGKTFDFDTPITSNISLSAKWEKEIYINISYETYSTYEIESIKILKGSSIDVLPDVYKDGYEFIGWYVDDELYSSKKLYSDTLLEARYIQKEINYNIGDNVLIIGEYSNTAFGNDLVYNFAYGWERYVLNIIEGSEYPYMVGNSNGVTGFFKFSSLEKVGDNDV